MPASREVASSAIDAEHLLVPPERVADAGSVDHDPHSLSARLQEILAVPPGYPFSPTAPLPLLKSSYSTTPDEWTAQFAQKVIRKLLADEEANPSGYVPSQEEVRALFDASGAERAAVDRARSELDALISDWRATAQTEGLTLSGSRLHAIPAEVEHELYQILGVTGTNSDHARRLCRYTMTTTTTVDGAQRCIAYWADPKRFPDLYLAFDSTMRSQAALHTKWQGMLLEFQRRSATSGR